MHLLMINASVLLVKGTQSTDLLNSDFIKRAVLIYC